MIKLNIKNKQILVSDICVDSRKVTPGSLFIAYKGANVDSHDFIPQAIKNGAKYIIGERSYSEIKDLLGNFFREHYIQVKNGREAWALLEAQRYGNPEKKLKIIGITGTDGKTTTSHLLYHILQSAGKKVGMLTTTGAFFDGKKIDTGAHTTTPPPDVIFKVLKQMVDAGLEYAILETTSHALVQKRVYGIIYEVSGVTNVTPEHLDLHKSYENLIKDKARIFSMSKHVVLIKSAKGISKILKYFPKQGIQINDMNNNANKKSTKLKPQLHLYNTPDDILDFSKLDNEFFAKFPGEYNKFNAALASKIAEILGINKTQIYTGLNKAKPPEGRFERIPNKLGINLVIDFAHTPNAIKDLLSAVRKLRQKDQRIIVIFGSAGERDHDKRPKMGKNASELADEVIVTMEDPRSENAYNIALDIVAGAPDYPFIIRVDREKAIELGIRIANPGDWVLILGKSHETSMNIGGIEYPWLDKDAVMRSLKRIYKHKLVYKNKSIHKARDSKELKKLKRIKKKSK